MGPVRPISGPLEAIRVSVAAAQAAGVRILHGDWGVLFGELSEEWVVDPLRRPMGVSPLGAVVLYFQPGGPNTMPDPAAAALGVGLAWADGFSDGFDGEASGYYLGQLNKRLYLAGLEAGMEFRFELTVRCPACGTRHFRSDPCPLCEERGRRREDAA
jgi:hypothetical protein